MLKNWDWPEVSILGADQKDRGLWGRECKCDRKPNMRSSCVTFPSVCNSLSSIIANGYQLNEEAQANNLTETASLAVVCLECLQSECIFTTYTRIKYL